MERDRDRSDRDELSQNEISDGIDTVRGNPNIDGEVAAAVPAGNERSGRSRPRARVFDER
jgi:hypothetical protein